MTELPFETKDSVLARPIPESYWVVPGKLLAGEYPYDPFSSELTRQKLEAFLDAGFNTFINLTNENEGPDYTRLLQEIAGENKKTQQYLRFPINDFGLPTHELMATILNAIDTALKLDRKIYLHCYGGIGRTGTTVGCFLVRNGLTGQQALNELARRWRDVPKSVRHPATPETRQQEDFILRWSEE